MRLGGLGSVAEVEVGKGREGEWEVVNRDGVNVGEKGIAGYKNV